MNILYLCPSPDLGLRDRAGWSTHIAAVIAGLRAHGHSVRPFLAAGLQPPTAPLLRSCCRRLVPAPLRRARRDLSAALHDRRLYPQIVDACQEFDAEAIYERSEVYHGVGARVAGRLNLPLVLEVNGPLVEERLAWGGLFFPGYARRLEAAKYRAADAVVTVSAALAEDLAANGIERSKIHAVPNGVDTTLFHPQRAHPGAVRQQFGMGRRLVIGFVGAFADWHGLETLIGAVGELQRSQALDIHLLLIGDGPAHPALRVLAQQAGLEGRASLPGSVPHDQVPHYLAAMDICVLPRANWYMSPIKLFEYGAMGRAVIAPRTPAVLEVMREGDDGLLVEPGCREELARAILQMAADPEARARMGESFQRRVHQQHRWDMVAGQVSVILERSVRARELSPAGSFPQAA